MKLAFPVLCLLILLAVYVSFSDSPEESTPVSQIELEAPAQSDTSQQDFNELAQSATLLPEENAFPSNKTIESVETEAEVEDSIKEDDAEQQENKEIHYSLRIDESTHHMIQGGASSDIGNIDFRSKLLPSNEVELTINLTQETNDEIELTAYFDLANFTMELDGKKGVLNKEHKKLLKLSSSQLQSEIQNQYEGYDYPDHALMLTQMLAYWSISPEGYVHDKRTIVSQ